MKKIVPFNKVLKFNNNISEISSISLEHNFKDMGDSLSGEFIILGSYILDDESRSKEEFNFKLPFDIALGVNYNKDNMIVDIDDFRYQVISSDEVEVDIDLYIDGEVIPMDRVEDVDLLEDDILSNDSSKKDDVQLTRDEDIFDDKIDMVDNVEINNENVNINNNTNDNLDNNVDSMMNVFDNIEDNNEYVTYSVYTVMEGDTIDTILNKYNITLEELNKYNDTSNIKPSLKLIIPNNEK